MTGRVPAAPHEFGAMLDLQNLALRTLNSPAGAPPRWPTMGADWPHVYHPETSTTSASSRMTAWS